MTDTLSPVPSQVPAQADAAPHAWQDTARSPAERVDALLAAMTLREKVAQLYGVWVGASNDGGGVAPYQHDMEDALDLDALLPHGLGQLTRPFGSGPVDAAVGIVSLARSQRRIVAAGRFGIPALAHEECLAGFTAWGATAYPVPLAWGATFDPGLVQEMSGRIGASMRSVGVHQGLAPVLDVVRDARWGRVEETIGEDPTLVGTIATAYVRGLESAGIVATLKHFIGYCASKAGRNLAPVSIGRREFNDVLVPPFEMAVRESGVRSVMHAYTDIDGVPTAADPTVLTGLLRDTWGFTGTVVADYFGIAFLKTLHSIAETWGDAAVQALRAGVDVELPTVKTFAEPLLAEIEAGRLSSDYVDRAARRVLLQKLDLGLLDADWSPLPVGWTDADLTDVEAVRGRVDLDPAASRSVARRIAEQSVVLLTNDGLLPVAPASAGAPLRIAVVGPNADDALNLLGCYSFPGHVGTLHPEVPIGIEIRTVLEAVRSEYPAATVTYSPGVTVDGTDETGIASAARAAADADLVIIVLGDRPGLFGRGTSGEGCDAESLELPGRQWPLLDAVLASGTPVVTVLVAGRPYFLHDAPERAAAVLQSFFPGEEGAGALAGVISGRVNPSGRLPVSVPNRAGGQPGGYLAAPLGSRNEVSNLDPTARFPFGHGLGYSGFDWTDPAIGAASMTTDAATTVALTVTNTGARPGADVVQLYLHDPVASVVRPVNRLIGYARVELGAGESARVEFAVHADLAAFTGRAGDRIIEPGALELRLGHSSAAFAASLGLRLTGAVRTVDHTRVLVAAATVTPL
ncbi:MULTISPECIES: beta-glucosidase [unclassified Cryobacterium]|uniref:beta-xylosidase/alpha-l-arabinosidase n=5 Tax=Cryobacterium TaxID=69578 RepID=UPI002AB3A41C|nr:MULTISPECIES: glycoside hydrolase family 3 N-terminal domain-containing protein [unclassified Cryobacterium]MDY7541624.1 glycoside hydrolase family 3 N-terminal domain-containing protein [Cryobacterium sp. 5B3]MEB0000998.1 glycoside hydrolase family 3 N-terminal domain-containing protein [Cryobacterium sp. RTS3]